MSSAHDDLLRRVDLYITEAESLGMKHLGPGHGNLVRDLRDALVAASTLPDAVRADIRLMTRSVGSPDVDALDAADRLEAFLAAHQPLEARDLSIPEPTCEVCGFEMHEGDCPTCYLRAQEGTK